MGVSAPAQLCRRPPTPQPRTSSDVLLGEERPNECGRTTLGGHIHYALKPPLRRPLYYICDTHLHAGQGLPFALPRPFSLPSGPCLRAPA